ADSAAKDELLPLFRFQSTHSDGKLTSLDEYIERMPAGQEEIYYVLGDDAAVVARSPHLDPFRASGLEVLFWVDPLDAFLAPTITEYKEKKLRNIDDADLELPDVESEQAEEEATPEADVPEADFNLFVGRCVTVLGDRVVEVR